MGDLQQPPPAALVRFKVPLTVITATYALLVLFAITTCGAKGLSLVLSELFVLVAAAFMVLRGPQCLGQCLLPFFLFAGIATVFGLINLLTLLSASRTEGHPGRGDMFSTSCPFDVGFKVPKNVTVYNTTNSAPITVDKDTEVLWHRNLCSDNWVYQNCCIILATLLDALSTWLGYRMVKAVRAEGGGAGAQGFMLNQFQGGGPFDGPPAGGRPPGNSFSGGQPRQPQQQARTFDSSSGGGTFQTFSGQGHTVGGS